MWVFELLSKMLHSPIYIYNKSSLVNEAKIYHWAETEGTKVFLNLF